MANYDTNLSLSRISPPIATLNIVFPFSFTDVIVALPIEAIVIKSD